MTNRKQREQLEKREFLQFLKDILTSEKELGIWAKYTPVELNKIELEYYNLKNEIDK
jgi:hypothetical protein